MSFRDLEDEFYSKGYKAVAGVDEVGRGCLAGPLVVVACVLPRNLKVASLDDSKKLTASVREKVYDDLIRGKALFSVVFIEAEEIDSINIHHATLRAMKQAALALQGVDCFLFDGIFKPELEGCFSTSVKDGDATVMSIAAASVLAKVTRDRYMESIDEKFPQYGFKKNKGYGTRFHLDAIGNYGASPIHRMSFSPLKER